MPLTTASVFATATLEALAAAASPLLPTSLRTVSAQVAAIFRHGAKKASVRLMVLMSNVVMVASQSNPSSSM